MKRALQLGLVMVTALSALAMVPAHARGLAWDCRYEGPCGKGRLIVEKVGPEFDRDPKVAPIVVTLELDNGRVLAGRGYELNKAYELDEIYKFECRLTHQHDLTCRLRILPDITRISFELRDGDLRWDHEITMRDIAGEGRVYATSAPQTRLACRISAIPPAPPREEPRR